MVAYMIPWSHAPDAFDSACSDLPGHGSQTSGPTFERAAGGDARASEATGHGSRKGSARRSSLSTGQLYARTWSGRCWRRRPMKSAQIRQEVKRLAVLPWTLELRRNQDGSYFARVLELPGCMTEGPNELQALKRL